MGLQEIMQQGVRFVKMRATPAIVLNFLFIQPITTIVAMSQAAGKAYNTISHIFKPFGPLGIVCRAGLYKRNKVYYFAPYLALLEKGYVESFTS